MEEIGTIAFGGSPGQKSLMHANQESSLLSGSERCFQSPLLTKNLALTVHSVSSLQVEGLGVEIL